MLIYVAEVVFLRNLYSLFDLAAFGLKYRVEILRSFPTLHQSAVIIFYFIFQELKHWPIKQQRNGQN